MKILIIKLGAIGDVLRTTSILKGLKDKYNYQIDWITKEESFDILKNNKLIDNIFLLNNNLINDLKNINYDLVISLDDEDGACRIALEVNKKKLIGAYFDGDKKTYTDDSSTWFDMGLISRYGKEKADILKKQNKKTYQQIISNMLGIKPSELILNLSEDELKFAENFAEKNNIKNGLVIGLNTGAGGRWKLKKWGIENTAKLADKLNKELNATVILFGGPEEIERNKKIKNLVKTKVIDAGCNNSLREFAVLINLCDLVVASDSLAMHIAIALKKKVVAFFTVTSSTEIEGYGRMIKILPPIDCICCYKKRCDKTPNCADLISIENIYKGIKKMNIKKILLVNPPQTLEERYGKAFSKIGTTLPPTSLMYIAATLEKKGYEVRIVDAQLKNLTIKQTVRRCKEINPDLIGISCMTSNFGKSIAFCNELKKSMDILILIGGPHVTIMPMQVLENKCVDFIVRGEGEYSILELIDALNSGNLNKLYDIDGIGFKDRGKPILTKKRALIQDLDNVPFPARHLVKLDEYKPSPPHYKRLPTTTMFTSRGCPYACTFCSSSHIWNRSYRQRSVKNVIKEIKYLIKEYGTKDINFWDDIFGVNKKWVYEFCDSIKKEGIDITWHCELRANLADKEMLKKMAEAGCWAIFYGIESTDKEILEAINKQITPEQIRNAIKWTKEAGIEVRANFILGLPKETPEKAEKMVKEIIRMNPDYIKFNILTPYPGTDLYNQIKAGKWGEMTEEFDKLTGYFPTFRPWGYKNLDELQKIKRWAYFRYYLRPRFILYRLSKIRSYNDIVRHLRGFRVIISL